MKVRDLMSRDPVVLLDSESCVKGAAAMRQHHTGDVLVSDGNGALLGIVTDRDIALRCVADGRDPAITTLRMVCSTEPVTLEPSASVEDAIRLMGDKHVRRIPITEDGKPVGIVSLGDLAEARDEDSVLGQISAASPNSRPTAHPRAQA